LRHIVAPNETRVIVVPTNSDFAPSRSGHRTKIGRALFPANAVADFESSGLLASHLTSLQFASLQMFYPLHFVVARKTFVAIVPFDGDVSRVVRGDRATVRFLAIKVNASANL
jgi:hypothetical protein